MLDVPRTRFHFYFSLLFHIVILFILIASFEFKSKTYVVESADKHIVQAIIVDSAKTQMVKPKPIPAQKQIEVKKIIPSKSVVKNEAVEPVAKSKTETIIIPDNKKQKALIEKQLLADLKKHTEQQKKLKQKILEKEMEKELQAKAAKSLQQQLLKEQKRVASAQAEKMQGIVNKYKALITQSIAQHWLVPNGVNKELSSELLIRIAPGGTVLDVQIVRSSGEASLDRSARSAVFKASPLPVPTDTEEFEPFRQFILKVKPENVLTSETLNLN